MSAQCILGGSDSSNSFNVLVIYQTKTLEHSMKSFFLILESQNENKLSGF